MTALASRGLYLALAGLTLGACATPAPVRETATVAAANVSIVSTNLRKFARDSDLIAAEREAIMRELDAQVSAASAEIALKLAAMEKAGERGKIELYRDLDRVVEDLSRAAREAATRDAELRKKLVEARAKLAPPVNPLATAAGRLADLGRKEEVADNLKFFGRFIGEVVKDVDQAGKTQGDAKASADKGRKGIAAALKGALSPDRDDLSK